MTVGTAPVSRKKGRRARLTVKRIDPWTTLKFSFVYGLAGMVVLLVAVVVLYGIVDALGVISSIRSFLGDVSDSNSGQGLAQWLGFGRVMLVAIVIGLVNVVLFTAFATLTAFIYNVCTDIVGGVEVTLAERN
jgi:isoprenylcysteine carboxyl methyltransferase (ICMT) family protein YpbQ